MAGKSPIVADEAQRQALAALSQSHDRGEAALRQAQEGASGAVDAERAATLAAFPLRCWRGELPLPVTYWLYGVGGNVGFALLLWRTMTKANDIESEARRLWLIYGMSAVWFVFVFGAIWNSSGRYGGPRVWKWLARLGVLSGIGRMAVELALVAAVGQSARGLS